MAKAGTVGSQHDKVQSAKPAPLLAGIQPLDEGPAQDGWEG